MTDILIVGSQIELEVSPLTKLDSVTRQLEAHEAEIASLQFAIKFAAERGYEQLTLITEAMARVATFQADVSVLLIADNLSDHEDIANKVPRGANVYVLEDGKITTY